MFQEVEAPRLQDSRYMKVVRLSAKRTDRLSVQNIVSVDRDEIKISKFSLSALDCKSAN